MVLTTQRCSRSYTEKRRGRKETEVARRIKVGIKRSETDLASNQFLMCAAQSGPLRDVHGVTQRREEGGRRQRWPVGEKGKSKGETQIQPVITSLSVLHSPDTQRDSQGWVDKRRGREEIQATWWRKRRSKGGESNQATDLTPK